MIPKNLPPEFSNILNEAFSELDTEPTELHFGNLVKNPESNNWEIKSLDLDQKFENIFSSRNVILFQKDRKDIKILGAAEKTEEIAKQGGIILKELINGEEVSTAFSEKNITVAALNDEQYAAISKIAQNIFEKYRQDANNEKSEKDSTSLKGRAQPAEDRSNLAKTARLILQNMQRDAQASKNRNRQKNLEEAKRQEEHIQKEREEKKEERYVARKNEVIQHEEEKREVLQEGIKQEGVKQEEIKKKTRP